MTRRSAIQASAAAGLIPMFLAVEEAQCVATCDCFREAQAMLDRPVRAPWKV